VDAVEHDDPIGVVLKRIAASPTDESMAPVDPRGALIDLSARPGRAYRSFLSWVAIFLLGAAFLFGVFGWRIRAMSRDYRAATTTLKQSLAEQLTELNDSIPGLSTFPDPVGRLMTEISTQSNAARKSRVEKPILAELERLMQATANEHGVKIVDIRIGATGNVRLDVPDAAAGPRIVETLESIPGKLIWSGSSAKPQRDPTMRGWTLSATWVTETPTIPGAVTAAGTTPKGSP
jgi:hypothetical protein